MPGKEWGPEKGRLNYKTALQAPQRSNPSRLMHFSAAQFENGRPRFHRLLMIVVEDW